MSNVSRSLTALLWIMYPLAVIIAVAPIIIFWVPDSLPYVKSDLLEEYGGLEHLLIWQKLLGFFVTSLPAALLLWAISHLLRLVRSLKAGQWFHKENEILCRRFGRAIMWFVLVNFFHRTLLVLILTATYPEGKKQLMFSLSSNDLMALVPAIFAVIFAHIVSLGRAQRDELKQIV
jgi:hypothetical protein